MDGVGVLPRLISKTVRIQSVEGSESKGMAVDQQQGRLLFSRHVPSLLCSGETMENEVVTSAKALEVMKQRGLGALADRMGIKLLELSAERAIATMPVDGNTQPIGLLHGGAHVVLAESLGSFAANVHAHPWGYAVGIEINASHHASVKSGIVTGTCTAIKLGKTLTTHEIKMTDEDGQLLSTVRITNYLRPKVS